MGRNFKGTVSFWEIVQCRLPSMSSEHLTTSDFARVNLSFTRKCCQQYSPLDLEILSNSQSPVKPGATSSVQGRVRGASREVKRVAVTP